jgi:hypothetical protein
MPTAPIASTAADISAIRLILLPDFPDGVTVFSGSLIAKFFLNWCDPDDPLVCREPQWFDKYLLYKTI